LFVDIVELTNDLKPTPGSLNIIGANRGPAITRGKHARVEYDPRNIASRSPRSWSGKPFFSVPKTNTC